MLPKRSHKPSDLESFDLTPVIDVVFLLIIFFMLVCRFIAEDKLKVEVPDQIQTAQSQDAQQAPLTITVLVDEQRQLTCAIDAQKMTHVQGRDLAALVTSAVNEALDKREDKIVRLRCDKRIAFGQVKYILAGISDSRAETLDWAVAGSNQR